MKTTAKNNIAANKELTKGINKVPYYSVDQFINDAERYINAIKENRVICNIGSVSRSGMSRTIKFVECHKPTNEGEMFNYYNFYAFISALGFTRRKDSDYFTIGGCGMDMIFHTNYTIIHRLSRLGFLTSEECAKVCQMTPPVL